MNSAETKYITTAIPFVNGAPHIGHAQEAVIGDALVRYYRQGSGKLRSLTGTDDNSLKNALAAGQCGISTRELVNQNSHKFYRLREALNLSFDDFIRTSSDPRHSPAVAKLWRRCAANGDIYNKKYRGLYCVGCEGYLNLDDLEDGCCPEHKKPPEEIEEDNYFFRLSRYQRQIQEVISNNKLLILPEQRRNEVLRFISTGLQDFSISRTRARARNWGIPVPGDDGQVIYVWFDALTNYISALGYSDNAQLFQNFWNISHQRIHVIGKGILRFHAVYWPAILLSAGVTLPTRILVHGYVTAEGNKVGKSLGNVIDPFELSLKYGSDALRYFLLRHINTTKDGDFDRTRLVIAYNTELADQLGNLARRSLVLITKYRNGFVPQSRSDTSTEQELIELANQTVQGVEKAFDNFTLHIGVTLIWRFVAAVNNYVDRTAPWQLTRQVDDAKKSSQRLDTILYTLAEALRLISWLCDPITPDASSRIRDQLGLHDSSPGQNCLSWGRLVPGTQLGPLDVLFPKFGGTEY